MYYRAYKKTFSETENKKLHQLYDRKLLTMHDCFVDIYSNTNVQLICTRFHISNNANEDHIKLKHRNFQMNLSDQ